MRRSHSFLAPSFSPSRFPRQPFGGITNTAYLLHSTFKQLPLLLLLLVLDFQSSSNQFVLSLTDRSPMSSPNGVAGTSSGNSNSPGNVVYSTIAPLKIRTSPMSNGTDSKSPTKSPISPSQPFPIIKSSGPISPRHSPRLRSPSSSRDSRSPSSPHAATLIIHMKKGEPSTGTIPLGLPSPSGSSSAGKLSSPGRNEKDRRASLASSESSGCSSDRSSILRSPIDARKENGKQPRSGSGTTSTSSGERMTSENDENRNNISSTSGGGISDVRGLLKGC